ncbi:MAG: hypothetical protein ACRD0N_03175 [Acidimicrobiales bacterium]
MAAVAGAAGLPAGPAACYLALRRPWHVPLPALVILVREVRALPRPQDVEAVLGVPVRAEVAWDVALDMLQA